MKRKLLFIVTCLFFGFCITILRPVPTPTVDNTFEFSDEVLDIFEGGVHDIVFVFKHSEKKPYINRGLERGLTIEELKEKLVGNVSNFKLIDHWTPLDFAKMSPSVTYIETANNEVLFDVIKD